MLAVAKSPSRAALTLRLLALAAVFITLFQRAAAHEHHDEDLPEGKGTTEEPIDSILWIHILVQIAGWGLLFPLGMVLGIIRSRWHVPVQTLGTMCAVAGHFLGHRHKGRKFGHNVHSSFAPWLEWMLFGQVVLGIYLKLHIERGFMGSIRKGLVLAHGILGKVMPVAAWVQFLFGGIVAMGFCRDDHLGQCAAHFIMGSAFVAYGIILTILLLVGQMWLRRTGKSQEFFDSLIIAIWGCINTFTEHRWGGPWVRNDLQHTSMGIIWWCAGLLGMWMSRTRDGRPKRNIIPSLVIFFTGYGMSGHPQELHLSTMVHTFFGYTLMAAGATRLIEISFILRDRDTLSPDGSNPQSFQFLPIFLLYASGFLFMGATEEQMQTLSDAHVTHVSYILILLSIAFLLFLFVHILLHIYAVKAFPQRSTDDSTPVVPSDRDIEQVNGSAVEHQANGKPLNGDAVQMSDRERQHVRDAQEFELDTLLGDDDDEDEDELERRRRRAAAAAAGTVPSAGDEGRVRL